MNAQGALSEALVEAYLKQGDHRRDLEKRVVTSNIVQAYIGQALAAGISLTVVILSIRAINAGYEIGGNGGGGEERFDGLLDIHRMSLTFVRITS